MKTCGIALIVAIALIPIAIAQGPATSSSQLSSADSAWVSRTISGNMQAPGGQAGGGTVALASGTTIPAELTKSVDAKKVKAGDPVTAKATQDVNSDGVLVIRKGAKILGHVTEAQARTKENAESRLGIVFDHVVLKDGSELTFNSILQALAAAPETSMPASDMGMGPAGGSMGANRQSPMGTGGVTGGSPPPSAMPPAGGIPPNAGSVNTNTGSGNGTAGAGSGTLTSTSQGVIGLRGLALNPGSGQGSVISSDRENVKLDSGTLMILRATSPTPK